MLHTFSVSYERFDGSTGSCDVTAATEREARRDFTEIVRHGVKSVISVTEVPDFHGVSTQELIRELLRRGGVRLVAPGSGKLRIRGKYATVAEDYRAVIALTFDQEHGMLMPYGGSRA